MKTPKQIMEEEAKQFSYHQYMTEGSPAITQLMRKAFEKILTQKRGEHLKKYSCSSTKSGEIVICDELLAELGVKTQNVLFVMKKDAEKYSFQELVRNNCSCSADAGTRECDICGIDKQASLALREWLEQKCEKYYDKGLDTPDIFEFTEELLEDLKE